VNPNENIRQAVLDGDASGAAALARVRLDAGLSPLEALDPFIAAIREAGDRFELGDFFLPQLLMASQAMRAALEVIFPPGQAGPTLSRGTVVAGTVQGDIHEIGKSLVCALLQAHGFTVVDLGGDVSADRFIEQIRAVNPDLLALSALLTTTMIQQKMLLDRLAQEGLRDRVKVLVGGAPVTTQWARDIGADGYAPDAARAVDLALKLVEK